MAETLVLRVDLEKGLYANFPENFKPYTDARAVVGIGAFNQEINEEGRPVFRTQQGVVVHGGGYGIIDDYDVAPMGTGMYVDNITPAEAAADSIEGLFKDTKGKFQNIEHATFVGEDAIAAAVAALEVSPHHDAVLLHQLAALAVNYAKRDVQEPVHSSAH
jgi:hypothetical protein